MRFKQYRQQTCNYKLSRSIGFLFLIDRLKTIGTFAGLLARPRLRFLIISLDLWLLYFDNGVSIPHLTVYHETLFTDVHDMNTSSVQVPHTLT